MESRVLDLNDFFYFVQVVDRGGFTAAGRTLRIPKSTLSHRIQQLETSLGVSNAQTSHGGLKADGPCSRQDCNRTVQWNERLFEAAEHIVSLPQPQISCP